MLNDAKAICLKAIETCLPYDSVVKTLKSLDIDGDVYLLAVGKAAFLMAKACVDTIDIKKGIVITKYDHVKGEIKNVKCYEAGHPIIDQNSIDATRVAIRMCSNLKENDKLIFLLSGGASSLFEDPLISLEELRELNNQILRKGMNIQEINTIRKKLSKVKGGKFANICKPARIYSLILSDVLSDRLDMIGSGPTAFDLSTVEDALDIIEKYDLKISDKIIEIIKDNKSVEVDNCENHIIGSAKMLYQAAIQYAEESGYKAIGLKDDINIDCRKAADYLYEHIEKHLSDKGKIALIMTGETSVSVKGDGLGGRNQELVFYMSKKIVGLDNVTVISLGSDGTDGPTDAAGGWVDGNSYNKLLEKNIDYDEVLNNNDSYHALDNIGCLIKTGPTGTNVNDITIALIDNN